jgi:hypothetical protein
MRRIAQAIFFSIMMILFASVLDANEINWTTPPVTISSAGLDASDPQVGVDGSGNGVVIWIENNLVKAKTKAVAGSWQPSPTILSNSGASSPRLAVDSNGNATALWLEAGVVKTANKPFGSNWASATALSSSGASAPQIACNSAGDLAAIWTNNGVIEASTKAFGGSWSGSPTALGGSSADSPQIAIGASGKIVAVWHETVSSIDKIYSADETLNGSWSAATIISDPTLNSINPQAAVDTSGNALAIWYQYEKTGSEFSNVLVRSSELPVSESWTTPVTLSDPGIYDPAGFTSKVAFDINGNALAVWINSNDGATFNVEGANKCYKGWSKSDYLIVSNLYALSADLSISSAGDAFIASMFYDSSSSSIVIQSAETDLPSFQQNYWIGPVTISTGTTNGYPRIATAFNASTTNNVIAVWLNYDGSHQILQTTSGTETILQPPTNLSVVQSVNNFGLFNEYYNTISWTASTTSDVTQYIILRNDLVLDYVDGSTTSYVDHNQMENEAVTYDIVAVDAEKSHSKIATVSFPGPAPTGILSTIKSLFSSNKK